MKNATDRGTLQQFVDWGNEHIPSEDWLETLALVHAFLRGRTPSIEHVTYYEADFRDAPLAPTPRRVQ